MDQIVVNVEEVINAPQRPLHRVKRAIVEAEVEILKTTTLTDAAVYDAPGGTLLDPAGFKTDEAGRVVHEDAAELWSPDALTVTATKGGRSWTVTLPASDEADLSQIEEKTGFYVEDYYNAADPEAERDLLPMLRALDAAYNATPYAPWPVGYGMGEVISHPNKKYVIPSGVKAPVDWADPFGDGERLIADLSRASLRGQRGTLIECNDTSGVACHLTASVARTWGDSSFSGSGGLMEMIQFWGPTLNDADDAGTLRMIYVQANDEDADVAHISLRNIYVSGAFIGWEFGDSAHQLDFQDCFTFFNKVGLYCPTGLVNFGERLNWKGGTFSGNSVSVINRSATSLFFDGVSFDYNEGTLDAADKTALGWADCPAEQAFVVADDGTTVLDTCHIEDVTPATDGGDIEPHFQALKRSESVEGLIQIVNSKFHLGTVVNYPFFWSDAAFRGIELRDASFHFALGHNDRYQLPHLVGGEGRVKAENISYRDNGVPHMTDRKLIYPTVAKQLSVFPSEMNSEAELAHFDRETYSTTPDDQPFRDTAVKFSGDSSFCFKVSEAGNQSAAASYVPVEPGKTILMSYRCRFEGLLANGSKRFHINALFARNDGSPGTAPLQGVAYFEQMTSAVLASDVDGWRLFHGRPVIAPGEHDLVILVFTTGGTTDWEPEDAAWLDELVVNVV